MNFLGYVEGWATYAENMSYTWTGLDDNLARCLQLNQDITLHSTAGSILAFTMRAGPLTM